MPDSLQLLVYHGLMLYGGLVAGFCVGVAACWRWAMQEGE